MVHRSADAEDAASGAGAFPAAFSLPNAGWIYLTLPKLLPEGWVIRLSYIFDPIPKLIEWLESIATGCEAAIWTGDEEGTTALLVYHRDTAVLMHSCSSDEVWSSSAVIVEPADLVGGVWRAFLAMVRHPDYRPGEWEMPESEPAITFDIDDERCTEEVDALVSARERANPYGGAILRFIESPTIEAFLEARV